MTGRFGESSAWCEGLDDQAVSRSHRIWPARWCRTSPDLADANPTQAFPTLDVQSRPGHVPTGLSRQVCRPADPNCLDLEYRVIPVLIVRGRPLLTLAIRLVGVPRAAALAAVPMCIGVVIVAGMCVEKESRNESRRARAFARDQRYLDHNPG